MPNYGELVGFICWVLFQALLYTVLPGRGTGQLTPAGNLLAYRINGFKAWAITTSLACGGIRMGLIDPCIIADHWQGLLVLTNAYGFLLAIAAYAKAHLAPTHERDRKFSGKY